MRAIPRPIRVTAVSDEANRSQQNYSCSAGQNYGNLMTKGIIDDVKVVRYSLQGRLNIGTIDIYLCVLRIESAFPSCGLCAACLTAPGPAVFLGLHSASRSRNR
jgi:hypothetical protein